MTGLPRLPVSCIYYLGIVAKALILRAIKGGGGGNSLRPIKDTMALVADSIGGTKCAAPKP